MMFKPQVNDLGNSEAGQTHAQLGSCVRYREAATHRDRNRFRSSLELPVEGPARGRIDRENAFVRFTR